MYGIAAYPNAAYAYLGESQRPQGTSDQAVYEVTSLRKKSLQLD